MMPFLALSRVSASMIRPCAAQVVVNDIVASTYIYLCVCLRDLHLKHATACACMPKLDAQHAMANVGSGRAWPPPTATSQVRRA